MTKHCVRLCLTLGFGLLALGCQPNLAVPKGNRVPTADARVLGKEGQNVTVDYMGAPVKITLDGSFSKDPDGPIKKYRWLSGKRKPGTGGAAGSGGSGAAGSGGRAAAGSGGSGAAGMASDDSDGGVAGSGGSMAGSGGTAGSMAGAMAPMFIEQRWVPPGAPDDWPEDVMQPMIELPEGEWSVVLWVEDERGALSMPSVLKITVQKPVSPEVQACIENVYDPIATACKTCLCEISEDCRMKSAESVCGADCWGFLSCLATKCPNYRPMDPDSTACLSANCAGQLAGVPGAQMIGPCVTMCPTQCRSQ